MPDSRFVSRIYRPGMRIDGRHNHVITSSDEMSHCLERLRKGMLLTQGDVASLLELGQPRYSRIEARPGAVNLSLLLDVLELLVARLVIVPDPLTWEEVTGARILNRIARRDARLRR